MGGYILDDGRKLQTDEYIEHLEAQRDQALKERDQLLEAIDRLDWSLNAYKPPPNVHDELFALAASIREGGES